MSDTPRTDAVEYDTGLRTAEECATGEDRGPDMVVPADHARTLERELAAEQAAREKAEAELKEDVGVIAVWRRRTEEAEAKVARLREALTETLEEGICWYGDCRGGNPDDLGWVQRARAALKDTQDG